MNQEQLQKVTHGDGFIAALDQSGGSTPTALDHYGIDESVYGSDDEMFDLIHAMRSRIMTSRSFDGSRILGAILFEMTMDRQVEGQDSAAYLWNTKSVVPFLKIDDGMADEADSVQLLKPIVGLDDRLARAVDKGIFGTKMRSVIKMANPDGVKAVVDQQFEIGHQVLEAGLVPIIEPEVDINSPEKAEAEALLLAALREQTNQLNPDQRIMLKLSLPTVPNHYAEFVGHRNVARVVALSGGYARAEANERLGQNIGVIASFSRALAEGLSAAQSDDDFDATLDRSIADIYAASIT